MTFIIPSQPDYSKKCQPKIATSLRFPELHANKSINKSIHVVDLNIERYDMIVGRELIRSLGLTAMALT